MENLESLIEDNLNKDLKFNDQPAQLVLIFNVVILMVIGIIFFGFILIVMKIPKLLR